jgi:arabinogalactan endo-1,4-beta-galactosidase
MKLLTFLLVALSLPALSQASLGDDDAPPFALGADLSLLKHLEDHGIQYQDAGVAKDALLILKDHGCNYVRLRLFLAPTGNEGQVNSLPYTLELARRVKADGLDFLLDLHYSDSWADPGHQMMPAQWKGLTHAQLVERVFSYTRDTLAAFQQAGCAPDMVEVGNEITNGFLWPDGGPLSEAKWDDFTDLLKAGIRGVHANDTAHPIKIVIHIDRGGDQGVSKWFFDHLNAHSVPFDVIGLSYYPFWNGPIEGLKQNLAFLAQTYGKDIIVAETGFNWRNGPSKQAPWPSTPEGQKDFLIDLIRTVAATPNGHGRGVFYWAPEWIEGDKWSGPKWSGDWENRALFDDSGHALPALDAFREAGKGGSRKRKRGGHNKYARPFFLFDLIRSRLAIFDRLAKRVP